jgi:hypothetical protein
MSCQPFFTAGDHAVCMTDYLGIPRKNQVWTVESVRIEDGHEVLTFKESSRTYEAWAFRKADGRDGAAFESAFRWGVAA